MNNHSQLLNDSTGCKEKEVKVGEYQFYPNNGFSADNNNNSVFCTNSAEEGKKC